MKHVSDYRFGGFPVTHVNVLRLISELEGSYQLLKYMGFKEDMETIEEIKKRYYKLSFNSNLQNYNEEQGSKNLKIKVNEGAWRNR